LRKKGGSQGGPNVVGHAIKKRGGREGPTLIQVQICLFIKCNDQNQKRTAKQEKGGVAGKGVGMVANVGAERELLPLGRKKEGIGRSRQGTKKNERESQIEKTSRTQKQWHIVAGGVIFCPGHEEGGGNKGGGGEEEDEGKPLCAHGA